MSTQNNMNSRSYQYRVCSLCIQIGAWIQHNYAKKGMTTFFFVKPNLMELGRKYAPLQSSERVSQNED
jgi:hypothetical protein